MTEIMICSSCKGKKRIIGLGNLPRDCPQCNGIGHVEVESSIEKEAIEYPAIKKKKGRKAINKEILNCDGV